MTLPKLPARPLLILPFLLLSAAFALHAAAEEFRSTGEQIERAIAEFKRLDAELQTIFEKKLEKEEPPQLREALLAAQRAWMHFREADGRYASVAYEGGSARMYYVNMRMIEVTRQRIKQLTAEE